MIRGKSWGHGGSCAACLPGVSHSNRCWASPGTDYKQVKKGEKVKRRGNEIRSKNRTGKEQRGGQEEKRRKRREEQRGGKEEKKPSMVGDGVVSWHGVFAASATLLLTIG